MSYPINFFNKDPVKPKNEQEKKDYTPPRRQETQESSNQLRDYGRAPLVVNIEKAALVNQNFRTALWTGEHLQVTLMSIRPGEDIGLEVHPDTDQFLMVMSGKGKVMMGKTKENLSFSENVFPDYAIIVPAKTWHNIINVGNTPLKLFSIYAPPEHPFGTVHRTKAEAEEAEASYTSAQPTSTKFIYTEEEEEKVY